MFIVWCSLNACIFGIGFFFEQVKITVERTVYGLTSYICPYISAVKYKKTNLIVIYLPSEEKKIKEEIKYNKRNHIKWMQH